MTAISVIMPVYNSKRYLKDAVCSILEQSFSDFELLLVDDGSTDGSGSLCDEIALSDARVRVFHIPNGGMCHARNYAICKATGDYIAFCDNDDCFLPGLLMTAYNAARSDVMPIDCVCFGRILRQYSEGGEVVYEDAMCPSRKAILYEKKIFEQYDLWASMSNAVWCRLYRRVFLEENNIKFNESLRHGAEDALFNAIVLGHAKSVSYIPESFYVWQRREGHSSSMGINLDTLQGIALTLQVESEVLRENGVDKTHPSLFGKKLLGNMVFQIINVRYKKERAFYTERILYEELRKIYWPYRDTIKFSSLPLAYRLEFYLLLKRHYLILYYVLIVSGLFRTMRGNDR